MQLCSICQRYIEPYKATYRCGDMETCSQECNIKRLEYIYMIDPSLSFPVKWITNETTFKKTHIELTYTDEQIYRNEPEILRNESCYPEIYHPEIRQNEFLRKEKIKFGRGTRSLKLCTIITFVPISVLLYKTLFSLII